MASSVDSDSLHHTQKMQKILQEIRTISARTSRRWTSLS
jgi:hypothetical protein